MNDVNKIKVNLLGIRRSNKVLDIGCSYGEQAFMIARQGFKVKGIDLSIKSIKKFNELARKEKLDCKGLVGNIEKMPFRNNCFDAIVATEVFEHIPNPETAVKECFRILKKKGRICVSVPTSLSEKVFAYLHTDWVKNSGHVNIFSEREILDLLTKSGFKVLKLEKQNFEWSVFWLIHSFFNTDFDDTGLPKENHIISKIYFKIWNYLYKLRVGKYLMLTGNKIFPKSIYIYLVKP